MRTKRKARWLTDEQLNAMPLWKLCQIALRDTATQEATRNSVVDMGVYFHRNGACRACFAGSVIRFSCDLRRYVFSADGYIVDAPRWTQALDDLRSGDVRGALLCLNRECPYEFSEPFFVPDYSPANDIWWRAMRELAKKLKDAGI